jgi:hypothetical protein
MTDTKPTPTNRASASDTRRVRSPKSEAVMIDVSPDPAPTKPEDWDEIQVGSLVLAWDRPSKAWYEAIVTNVIDGACWLKWRDYPEENPVVYRREQLALMKPGQDLPVAA